MRSCLLYFLSCPRRKFCLKAKSLILVCFVFSSCITTLEIYPDYKKPHPKVNYNAFTHVNQHVFLFGIISTSAPVHVHQLCKDSSWQMVRISRPMSHLLISLFTLGIYTPVKVQVHCEPATFGL